MIDPYTLDSMIFSALSNEWQYHLENKNGFAILRLNLINACIKHIYICNIVSKEMFNAIVFHEKKYISTKLCEN